MPNPLMRVMLNNTLNRPSINEQVQDKNTGAANLREEQEKLLKEILAKHDHIAGKGIKLITLEELQKDYQRDGPAEEKNEMNKAGKNLVSLASVGKLRREG